MSSSDCCGVCKNFNKKNMITDPKIGFCSSRKSRYYNNDVENVATYSVIGKCKGFERIKEE
jgi:hypothetical protein